MSDRTVGRRRLLGLTGGLVAGLAAWNNVIVTRLPGYPASYVAANLGAAAVLLAGARSAGLTWDELGLARRVLPAGLRWGGACAGAVAAGLAVAVAVPALRPLLTDARVEALDGGEIVYQALVRVPFGTVLWEEVAFRGVLLAALVRLVPLSWAAVGSSAVFGIWHVRPTLAVLEANDVVGGAAVPAAVLLACAGTAAAGLLFTWLRVRSGSLLAPVLLHLATNSLGTVAAAAAIRLS